MSKIVSIPMPDRLLEQVDAEAAREMLSRSDIIRRLIAAGLRKQTAEAARS